ncbi:MAG: hypothetical protein ABRQ39_22905 [Candidatus Eremiobacterota bacterium]
MKKNTIISFVILSFILIILTKAWSNNDSSKELSDSYIFVKQWGSMGRENGQFGGIGVAPESTFIITDETIENLKNKIDTEKLNTLEDIKNREFNKYDDNEFRSTLKELNFNEKEIYIIMGAAALKKVSDRMVNGPLYIAVDKSDNIYVSDYYNGGIQKFDSEGNFLTKWNGLDPRGITVDFRGYVYVVDYSRHCVQKFDSQGNFLLKWGEKGLDDGKFDMATDIAADPEGYIYVLDATDLKYDYVDIRMRSNLQKFDSNGNFVKKWHLLSFEIAIKIDATGNIFTATYNKGCGIARINSLDNFITSKDEEWGWLVNMLLRVRRIPKEGEGEQLGSFLCEWAWATTLGEGTVNLATDSEGNLFVVDKQGSCVYKLDPNTRGKILAKWGSFGSGEGEFNRPEAVAVDSKGNVYVMDTGNYRIQKFAPVSNTNN